MAVNVKARVENPRAWISKYAFGLLQHDRQSVKWPCRPLTSPLRMS